MTCKVGDVSGIEWLSSFRLCMIALLYVLAAVAKRSVILVLKLGPYNLLHKPFKRDSTLLLMLLTCLEASVTQEPVVEFCQ